MIHIPYELIEAIAGTWVADHFNEICSGILVIGLILTFFRQGGNNGRGTAY